MHPHYQIIINIFDFYLIEDFLEWAEVKKEQEKCKMQKRMPKKNSNNR
jgi:hypothetical protein